MVYCGFHKINVLCGLVQAQVNAVLQINQVSEISSWLPDYKYVINVFQLEEKSLGVGAEEALL